MKKQIKLFAAVFAIMLVGAAGAFPQDNSNGLTGFFGIEFGTLYSEVKKAMKKKDWSVQFDEKGKDGRFITYIGGTYAGKKTPDKITVEGRYSTMSFHFTKDDKFHYGEYEMKMSKSYKDAKKEKEVAWTRDIEAQTVAKYNLKQSSSSKTTNLYEGANNNKFEVRVTNTSDGWTNCRFRFIFGAIEEAKKANVLNDL